MFALTSQGFKNISHFAHYSYSHVINGDLISKKEKAD